MRKVLILALLALAACGGGDSKGDNAQSGTAAPATPAPPQVACSGLPDFVSLAEPTKVTLCSHGETGPGHLSGTVTYRSAMKPQAVMEFYRQAASKAGMPGSIANPDPAAPMYAAREGSKRSFVAMAVPQQDGADVTVNWGKDK